MALLALVPGSTGGIGLGTAKSLAEPGFRLILNGLVTLMQSIKHSRRSVRYARSLRFISVPI